MANEVTIHFSELRDSYKLTEGAWGFTKASIEDVSAGSIYSLPIEATLNLIPVDPSSPFAQQSGATHTVVVEPPMVRYRREDSKGMVRKSFTGSEFPPNGKQASIGGVYKKDEDQLRQAVIDARAQFGWTIDPQLATKLNID